MSKKALIVVDYQNDFVDPKGSLYVSKAEKIYPKLLKLINENKEANNLIIATKNYHPENHCSFKEWPLHCIAQTKGSDLYKLDESLFDKIFLKGTRLDVESYSGFKDNLEQTNGLDEYLKEHNVEEIVLVGVALDICVAATMVDAIKLNYHGYVDLDYTVGIENKINF